MKRPAAAGRFAARAGLLLGALGSVAAGANTLAPRTLELTEAETSRLGIEWVSPEPQTGRTLWSAPAVTVVPASKETVVSAPVGGLVTRLLVAEGSEVEAGDALIELRSLELLAAQREYVDAAAAAKLAAAQLERDRTLHDEGIIARRRLDETEAAALAARLHVEQAGQQLRLAGADDAALGRLAASGELAPDLTLRAPSRGVVVARHGAVGEQVDALEPIVRLADLGVLWLEMRVPQERVDQVVHGMQLAVDASGRTLSGVVFHVGRVVDTETQTVLVRAAVDNLDLALRAGQLLPARILAAGQAGELLAVPTAAVSRIDGQAFVFARIPAGVRLVPVRVVGEYDGRAQIVAEQLDAGAEIAGRGVSALKALLTAEEE